MKTQSLLCLLPLTLTGCVGFNTALFMTKSNVGLDIDSKPPTAEINISRKEGVVEPLFEGGQTPPVMASFSTKVGHNKMESFFLGVNQTFAGGDAAITMAKLYDRTNDFSELAATNFDSGLHLSKPIKANSRKGFLGWRKRLFGLAEPGEVRPFFFGTDTQFGMKVAWNGVGGPYPDTVKLGFNRKEMAVAPITLTEENEKHVVRIPSFLATVDGGGRGGLTDGTNALGVKQDVNWIQYFATGKSADQLARQYGVRKAMLERADPKAAALSDHEAAARGIEERRGTNVLLSAEVDREIDRLSDGQLASAAQAAKESGLFTDEMMTGFGNLDVNQKRTALKNIAKDRTARDEIEQVSQYLQKLKAIQ